MEMEPRRFQQFGHTHTFTAVEPAYQKGRAGHAITIVKLCDKRQRKRTLMTTKHTRNVKASRC